MTTLMVIINQTHLAIGEVGFFVSRIRLGDVLWDGSTANGLPTSVAEDVLNLR